MTQQNVSADDLIAQEEKKAMDALAVKDENPAPVNTAPLPPKPEEAQPIESKSAEKKEQKEVKTPDAPTDQVVSPTETQTATETETENDLSQFSAKAQNRFRELSEKAKKVDVLEKEIARLKGLIYTPPIIPDAPKAPVKNSPDKSALPWLPGNGQQTENQTLTAEEAKQIADTQWAENNRKKAITDRLSLDILRVEDEFEELRKPSTDSPNPKFNQNLVKQISDNYGKLFKNDPATSLYDYTKWVMGLKQQGAEEARKQGAATLTKQAAEQAIDPSGAPNAKPDDNSIEKKIRNAKNSEELAALEKSLPHAD